MMRCLMWIYLWKKQSAGQLTNWDSGHVDIDIMKECNGIISLVLTLSLVNPIFFVVVVAMATPYFPWQRAHYNGPPTQT